VVYNSYTGFFNNVIMVATFEANGIVKTKLEMYNIKRYYYSAALVDIFRLVMEVCFIILLLYYFIIETIEISGDITQMQKEHDKKEIRKALLDKMNE
jgi:hypothetical protein